MKYKLISFTLLLVISITSCNKKDSNTPNEETSTTGQVNPSLLSGGELHTLSKQYNNGATFGFEDSLLYAYFFDSNASGNYANAGSINYNGVTIANYFNEYQDTTFTINIHQPNSVWNIGGSSMITAFSHTFNPSFPTFTGNSFLPDSFSISTGFTINFGNSIANITDTVLLCITDNDVVKKIAPNQTSCNITPTDLLNVSINNGGNIKLQLTNKTTVVYNNKKYYVYNNVWHTKYGIKIKP